MAQYLSSRSVDADELIDLYEWLDSIPFSMQRKQVEKDFSDGVLAAEIVHYYFPHLVNLKEYRPWETIQERISQWKLLNTKVFRRLGLNLPTNVITELSIAKIGVAQSFLFNLRACLTLSGAYTIPNPISVLSDPVLHHPLLPLRAAPVFRYDNRYNSIISYQQIYPEEFEFYWQKKQAERVLKSGKSRKNDTNVTKSFSNLPKLLPPIANPYAARNIELNGKTQQIMNIEDEIEYLRDKFKKMEVLLNKKNSKIQLLLDKIERSNKKNF